MTSLTLRDLSDSKVLDTQGLSEIKGGLWLPQIPLFGITSATAGANAHAIGPNGSYADTYTNAFAYRDPFNLVSVASATSTSVAVAY
jgi:hypothetical protein